MSYWGNHPDWQRLSSREKAAAMALLEADNVGGKVDVESARNALGAMINRAARDGVDIGQHVSGKIYQPTIEPAQFARLSRVVGSPEHQQLMALYDGRVSGREPDWVQGATHFLAPEKTMLALEAGNPSKYRSWRQWTKYDDATGQYAGVTLRDKSHAFLAPEGAHSAKFGDATPTGTMPAMTEAAPPATTPTAAGGWLTQVQAEAPGGSGGMLGTLFADVGETPAAAPGGGWLGQLAGALDPPGEQPRQAADREDAASDGAMPEMKMKRPRVDMKRVAAILQSRSRLGT